MATDLRIVIPNQPGRCARVLQALADAGINLDGVCGDIRPGETWGFVHILVEDADKAASVLEEQGVEVTSRHEVDVVEVENRPGAIAELMMQRSESGENVEVIYTLTGNQLVIGTDGMREPISGVRVKDAKYT